ncbi:DUF7331 family protein [Halorhabdus rudnickae]|uniref:DUF7331 family protein n=1 Tax=Halorhabdus rudnickae TaxID=1775544 RepID=UPI0010829B56|nr:hypothetical protein [Halorhabdus rudnickae]
MSNPANGSRSDGATSREPTLPEPSESDATVEFYETEDGTVLYDAENPMAWIYSDDATALPDHR